MTPNLLDDSARRAWPALLLLVPVVLSLALLMLASFLSWPLQAHSARDDQPAATAQPSAASPEWGVDHGNVDWDTIDVSPDPSPLSVGAYGP